MERFANVNEHDAKVLMEIEKIVGEEFIKTERMEIVDIGDSALCYAVNNNGVVTSIAFYDINLDTAKIYKLLSNLDNLNDLIIDKCVDKNLSHISLSGIEDLKQLNFLVLDSNRILDISPLSNLLNLQQLSLSNDKIFDISHLSNLSNLQQLHLKHNLIFDISHLSNLSNLQQLHLEYNLIFDISHLSNLSNLQQLYLNRNLISDISHLSNLSNLQQLYLNINRISNISHLSNLSNLEYLDLSDNQISDISPLSNLSNLEYLDLSGNQISDISPLSNLSNLQQLHLKHNQIDIPHLSNLSNLQQLYLNSNRISNISHLSNLSNLEYLDLSCNQISDISPLSNLSNLQQLHLDSNQIDIPHLSNLSNLQQLYLNSNRISNISHLSNLSNLQQLYLNSNRISNISHLSNLSNLQRLGLIDNRISNISHLSNLSNLQQLHLEYNQISDISPLSNLSNLQQLHLNSNQIDIPHLSNLSNLQRLHLKHNLISDISHLSNLSNLQRLHLEHNLISDISHLSNLSNLQRLHLEHNLISDISHLSNLSNLQQLYLNGNRISNISHLSNLSNLQQLYLNSNRISNISHLSNLSNLQQLHLEYNQISDISPLSNLSNLQQLHLEHNQISDILPLSNLSNLQQLYLNRNQISDISHLSNLSNLQRLHLEHNLISDISHLSNLSNLQRLHLEHNLISDISHLSNLSNLQQLYLNGNRISDISHLSNLSNLQQLHLEHNQIQTIPQQLYKQMGQGLSFHNNPITSPPLAVLEQGYKAVMNYYKQLKEQGKIYLNECKLLILGDAGVGKTSLNKKIIDKNATLPAQEEYTKGTNVTTYQFSHTYDGQELNYKAHIWDFGGQTVYYNLHRYFMTDRSLYILVLDSNNKGTHFTEWLWAQKTYGIDSPLLVVNNHKRGNEHTFNLARYASDFPSLRLPILDINLEHIEASQHQLLVDKLQAEIRNLPVIMEGVPSYWGDVRAALENLKQSKKHIRREQFDEICAEHHITEEADISTMLSYFHNIGILLCYQQNDNISDIVVLDMQWVLDNTYSILNDNDIAEKQAGKFTQADFKRLIPSKYIRLIISNLMEEFHIIYTNEQDDYIAPALLPDTDTCETEFNNYHLDREIYQQLIYEFSMPIPIGLFHQLIVKLHHYIYDGLVSCYEVVLDKNNTRVLIVESPIKHTISIQLKSSAIENLKGFQAIIMEHIDSLTERYRTKKDTLFIRKTPCICAECNKSTTPHFYDYDKEIARYKEHSISTIRCVQSLKEVSIEELYGYLISTPVVYCMFGNPDKDLHFLQKEYDNIRDALGKLEYSYKLRLYREVFTNKTKLLQDLELLGNQIEILHFGGHADGDGLYLDYLKIRAEGLQLLAKRQLPRIKLVVLNGCATQAQVHGFIQAGVPLVIATTQKINDKLAAEFAGCFYTHIAKGESIQQAFEYAIEDIKVESAGIDAQYRDSQKIANFKEWAGSDTNETWTLFYNKSNDLRRCQLVN